jgi:hypothetical protein
MSIVLQEVAFPARAPDLRRIAEEVGARSGLEVSVTESSEAERGDAYDVHAQFAFACAPEERIAVYTLHPAAVRDRYKIAFADDTTRPARLAERSAAPVKETPEAGGAQVVYIKGLWRQELTLLFATQQALERLGGKASFPLSDPQRREYDRPFTEAELAARRRKYRLRWQVGRVLWVLLLPVTIPWTLLKWIVIAILHGVGKVGRMAKEARGLYTRN